MIYRKNVSNRGDTSDSDFIFLSVEYLFLSAIKVLNNNVYLSYISYVVVNELLLQRIYIDTKPMTL